MNVVTLIGSLRADSHNRQLVAAAAALLPAGSHVADVDFSTLPYYSEELDAEGKTPASVEKLRQEIVRFMSYGFPVQDCKFRNSGRARK